jgi:hypothetical protein
VLALLSQPHQPQLRSESVWPFSGPYVFTKEFTTFGIIICHRS